MNQFMIGIIAIVAGSAVIIFRKRLVRESITFQNKVFGFRFGEKEVKMGDWLAPLAGAGFIITGILSLLCAAGWL